MAERVSTLYVTPPIKASLSFCAYENIATKTDNKNNMYIFFINVIWKIKRKQ